MPLGAELRRTYETDFKYVVLSSWTKAHLLTYEEKDFHDRVILCR